MEAVQNREQRARDVRSAVGRGTFHLVRVVLPLNALVQPALVEGEFLECLVVPAQVRGLSDSSASSR